MKELDQRLIFKLDDVSYSYLNHRFALMSISLEIQKGESIAVIGANGSGKTTLLKMLDGLIFPSKGSIYAFGRKITEKSFDDPNFNRFFRKNVVLLFQDVNAQLFSPTVEDEIAFGLIQLGIDSDMIKEKIRETAEFFRISHLLGLSPYQLSEGEKKKVALASLLVIEPTVLLLDEPTNGLDPRSVRELLEFIKRFRNENKTIITATHDLKIIPDIAEKIYVLGESKEIVKVGDYESIFSDLGFLIEANLM